MKNTHITYLLLFCLLAVSCSTAKFSQQKKAYSIYKNLSTDDKNIADTLIKKVLDNEGLYTVIGKLKPLSSVTELYLAIAAKDTTLRGNKSVTDTAAADLQKLKKYQNIVNALQFGDLNFMISPYKANQKEQRAIQITVYRKSLVDSLIKANQSFYGQFGFVPGTKPEILINTTEFEHKYNRFRAYGYLFGYPEHAVTFFTEAAISENKTGAFVKRDFFHIPVFSGVTGRFVYATPKGYQSTTVDTAIFNRANYNLAKYKLTRAKMTRKDGSVKYYKLLQKLNN